MMTACAIVLLCGCAQTPAQTSDLPHLEQRDGMKKLIVDGNPFICVAGEVANTSSSDEATMKTTLARLAKANLNTVLTVVSWDLVEPQEGKFDFSLVDYQIEAARANNLRLIILWMGSWKNGLSHFEPAWVKADQARFPRVVNAKGRTLEILSTLSQANRDADAKAFAAVMRRIHEVDTTHVVIGIQVENEVGVLGSTRDFCPAANEAFAQPVPQALTAYLQKNKDTLRPELKKIWDAAGDKTSGTWEEVFGKNVQNPQPPASNAPGRAARPAGADLYNHTDEIFMAWNYSSYIGHVAAAGKKEHDIPMYVNTWLVQPSDLGPGDYPSGGPEPLVHDIWHAGGPAIDILAPDIYLPDYRGIITAFAQSGNPAWNPENRQNANTCWMAFTELNLLCYSPFGIDGLSPDGPFARTYRFINSISGAIAQAQGENVKDTIKLIKLQPGDNPGKVEMGNYVLDFTPVKHTYGQPEAAAPGEATPPAGGTEALAFLDSPFVLIMHTAPDEYYFATNGYFPFRVFPKTPGNVAAVATVDLGAFENGKWVLAHRLNGDDIMGLGYDINGAAANHQSGTEVPLGSKSRLGEPPAPLNGITPVPTVWRVTFYNYK
jgi:hypothetical protein